MAKTVGDFLYQRLRAWGVQRVFGYPGDGINGIMAAFEHAGDERPRFIQARHEELAAFMAVQDPPVMVCPAKGPDPWSVYGFLLESAWAL